MDGGRTLRDLRVFVVNFNRSRTPKVMIRARFAATSAPGGPGRWGLRTQEGFADGDHISVRTSKLPRLTGESDERPGGAGGPPVTRPHNTLSGKTKTT